MARQAARYHNLSATVQNALKKLHGPPSRRPENDASRFSDSEVAAQLRTKLENEQKAYKRLDAEHTLLRDELQRSQERIAALELHSQRLQSSYEEVQVRFHESREIDGGLYMAAARSAEDYSALKRKYKRQAREDAETIQRLDSKLLDAVQERDMLQKYLESQQIDMEARVERMESREREVRLQFETAAERRKIEYDAELKQRDQARAKLEQELAALRDTAKRQGEALTRSEKSTSALEEKLAASEQERETLERGLRDLEHRSQKELDDLAREHERLTASLRQEATALRERLQQANKALKEANESTATLRAGHALQLQQLNQKFERDENLHKQNFAALQAHRDEALRLADQLTRDKEEAEGFLKAARSELESTRNNAKRVQAELRTITLERDRLLAAHKLAIGELRLESDRAVADERRRAASTLEEQAAQYEQVVADLQAEKQQLFEQSVASNNVHQQAIAKLEQQMKQLSAQHAAERKQVAEQSEAARKQLVEKYLAERKQMAEQHARALAALKSETQQAMERRVDRDAADKQQLTEHVAALVSQHDAELRHVAERHAAEVETVKADLIHRQNEAEQLLRAQFEKELADKQAMLDRLTAMHRGLEKQLADLRASSIHETEARQQELATMRVEYEAKQSSWLLLESTLNASIADLNAKVAEMADEMVRLEQVHTAKLEQSVYRYTQTHKEALAKIDVQHKSTLQEKSVEHQKAMQELVQQNVDHIEELERSHSLRFMELEEAKAELEQRLQAELLAAREEIARLTETVELMERAREGDRRAFNEALAQRADTEADVAHAQEAQASAALMEERERLTARVAELSAALQEAQRRQREHGEASAQASSLAEQQERAGKTALLEEELERRAGEIARLSGELRAAEHALSQARSAGDAEHTTEQRLAEQARSHAGAVQRLEAELKQRAGAHAGTVQRLEAELKQHSLDMDAMRKELDQEKQAHGFDFAALEDARQRASALDAQVQELAAENARLTARLETTAVPVKDDSLELRLAAKYESKMKSKEVALANLNMKIAEATRTIKALEAQASEDRKQLEIKDAELADLRRRLAETTSEGVSQHVHQASEADLAAVRTALSDAEQLLADMTTKASAAEEAVRQAQHKLSEETARASRLGADLDQSTAALRNLQAKHDAAEQKAAVLGGEHAKTMDALHALQQELGRAAGSSKVRDSLRAEIDEKDAGLKKLGATLAEGEAFRGRLSQENASLLERIGAAEQSVKQLEAACASKEEALRDAEARVHSLAAEVDQKAAALHVLEAGPGAAASEHVQTASDLAAARSEIATYAAREARMKELFGRREQELRAKAAAHLKESLEKQSAVEAQLKESLEKHSAMEAQLKELLEKQGTVEAQLAVALIERNQFEHELLAAQDEVSSMADSLAGYDELRGKYDEVTKELADVRDALEKAESGLDVTQRESRDQLVDVSAQHEQALAAKVAEYDQAHAATTADHEQALAAKAAEHEQALKAASAQYEQEIESLKALLDEQRAESARLAEQRESAEKAHAVELDALRRDLAAIQSEKAQAEARLEEERAALQQSHDERARSEHEQIERLSEQLRQENDAKHAAAAQHAADIEARSAASESALAALSAKHEVAENALRSEIDTLTASLRDVEAKLEQAESASGVLAERLKQDEQAHAATVAELAKARDGFARLAEDHKNEAQRSAALVERLGKAQENEASLAEALKQMRGNEMSLVEQLKDATDSLTRLSEQLNEAQDARSHVAEQLEKAHGDIARLSGQLEQTQGDVARRLEQAHSDNARISGQLEQAQSDYARVSSQLEQAQSDRAHFSGQLEQAQSDYARVLDQLEQAQSDSARASTQLEHAQNDYARASTQLEQAQSDSTRLDAQLEQAHSSNARLTAELEQAQGESKSERAQFADRVAALTAEVAELTERVRVAESDRAAMQAHVAQLEQQRQLESSKASALLDLVRKAEFASSQHLSESASASPSLRASMSEGGALRKSVRIADVFDDAELAGYVYFWLFLVTGCHFCAFGVLLCLFSLSSFFAFSRHPFTVLTMVLGLICSRMPCRRSRWPWAAMRRPASQSTCATATFRRVSRAFSRASSAAATARKIWTRPARQPPRKPRSARSSSTRASRKWCAILFLILPCSCVIGAARHSRRPQ